MGCSGGPEILSHLPFSASESSCVCFLSDMQSFSYYTYLAKWGKLSLHLPEVEVLELSFVVSLGIFKLSIL